VLREITEDGWVTEEDSKKIDPKALPLGFLFGFKERKKTMRELRLYKEETVCYITVRTNNREALFQDNSDYEYFLEVLKSRKQKYGFRLYAYCLLNNHYHLLIEPLPEANISKIMQAMNTSYTLYFNKKYNRTGHLVGGRFESKLLNKDNTLLTQTIHIHLNPIRLGVSNTAQAYKWSSYSEYMEGAVGLTDKEYILSFIDSPHLNPLPKGEMKEFSIEESKVVYYKEVMDEEAKKISVLEKKDNSVFAGINGEMIPPIPSPLGERVRVREQNRLLRLRLAMVMMGLVFVFQYTLSKKVHQNSNYNNNNEISVKQDTTALPIYSGQAKPQGEKLVWELWKLGPRE
jgi:REP element-mobilizing transposase RayT